MGVDHGGGSGDKSPPSQNLERGGLSPQILLCCKILSTILLALQCRKMCFLPLQQDFYSKSRHSSQIYAMLRGYLRSIATWGQPTSQGTRNLPEYQISTQSGNAQLSYCSHSRFPWTGHFGNQCAFISVFANILYASAENAISEVSGKVLPSQSDSLSRHFDFLLQQVFSDR